MRLLPRFWLALNMFRVAIFLIRLKSGPGPWLRWPSIAQVCRGWDHAIFLFMLANWQRAADLVCLNLVNCLRLNHAMFPATISWPHLTHLALPGCELLDDASVCAVVFCDATRRFGPTYIVPFPPDEIAP